MKPKYILPSLALFTLAVTNASAQINQWTGATSGNWNTPSNWSNNSFPNGPGNDLILNNNGLNKSLNLSANVTARTMYLYGGDYSLSPAAIEVLTIQGGGFVQLGSGTFVLNNNVLGVAGNDINFTGDGNGSITLNGAIDNLAQRFDKFNESNVTLTNTYTTTNVSSTALRIRAGNLILSSNGSVSQGAAAQITLGATATYQAGRYHNNGNAGLVLDNTATNNTNRVTDTNQVNISNRALIEFRGNASAASTETFGTLNSAGGAGSLIRVDSNGSQSAWLTFAAVTTGSGAITVDTNGNPTLFQYLVPTGDSLGSAGTAGGRVIFTTAPTLTNGIIRYSIVKDESTNGGATFATYDATVDNGQALGVQGLTAYTTTDIDASTGTDNVDISGSATLTADSTANAIRITPTGAGQSLELDINTLNLSGGSGSGGGFIFNGGHDYAINGSGITGVTQNSAATYLYINSNTLTINAPYVKSSEFVKAGNGALVINGEFNNASGRQVAVDDGASADDMTINGDIIGGGSITKSGQGTLVLGGSGDNSGFFANFNVNAGTVVLDKSSEVLQNSALGSGTVFIGGGTLSARNTAVTLSNTLSLGTQGSSLSGNAIGGNAAITFEGTVQGIATSGQTYPLANNSSAVLTLSGSTITGHSGSLTSNNTSTLEFSGSGTTSITGDVVNYSFDIFTGTAAIAKSGSGSLILSGTNSYTGNTQVNAGYLRLDSASALGAGYLEIAQTNYSDGYNAVVELGTGNTNFTRALGTSAGQVRLGGNSGNGLNNAGFASVSGTATVNLGGAGAPVTWASGTSFFNAGGALILGSPNVAGTVDFQNAINLGNGNTSNITRTFNTLNGSAAVDGILSGVIANASTGGTNNGINKTGAGTLALTNANTYTGTTTVTAGTLLANNTSGSATGAGAVTVSSAAALGGSGIIGGATTLNGKLAPGAGAVGTLTFSSGLTFGALAADSLVYELGAPTTAGTTYDTVATANLALGAGTLAFSSFKFIDTGSLAAGVYTLVSSANPITGTLGTPFGTIGAFTGTLSISGGTNLILTVTAGGASAYDTWAGGTFANPFSNTTPTVDFELDGLTSLMEFVLGGDPTINDTPSIRPSVTASGSDMVVTFKRSDVSELQPVTVKVQVSSDLATWNPADDITIGATNGSGPNGATYTVNEAGSLDTIVVTIPKAAATKKFARVIATQ